MEHELKVFSGKANTPLALKIAERLGISLGAIELKTFSDGEIWVKYGENVRGCDVFLIQSTTPPAENLLELLIMVDAARRASAKRITVVIPYFGYARQDRKDQPRVSITAKLVANLITEAGADRILTMDLHTPQLQGFFDIPVDHLYGSRIFVNHFQGISDNLVVVSPDVGGIKMARSYGARLNAGLVVSDKRRPKANVAEIVNIIGEVDGKDILIVDDLIDTGGTFANTIAALKQRGALKIYGAVTHGVLSGPAIQRIQESEIERLAVSDTIDLPDSKKIDKIKVLTAADIFAEAINRIHMNESVSLLFDVTKG